MGRPPVDKRAVKMKIATDLPIDLVDELDRWCRVRGVKKNLVIERALRGYLAMEAAGG